MGVGALKLRPYPIGDVAQHERAKSVAGADCHLIFRQPEHGVMLPSGGVKRKLGYSGWERLLVRPDGMQSSATPPLRSTLRSYGKTACLRFVRPVRPKCLQVVAGKRCRLATMQR